MCALEICVQLTRALTTYPDTYSKEPIVVPETGAPTIEATNLSHLLSSPGRRIMANKAFKSPTVTFSDEILESSPEKPVEV